MRWALGGWMKQHSMGDALCITLFMKHKRVSDTVSAVGSCRRGHLYVRESLGAAPEA
jgi:hypothetical protein